MSPIHLPDASSYVEGTVISAAAPIDDAIAATNSRQLFFHAVSLVSPPLNTSQFQCPQVCEPHQPSSRRENRQYKNRQYLSLLTSFAEHYSKHQFKRQRGRQSVIRMTFGRQARLGERGDSGLTAYRRSEFATLDKMRLRYKTRLGRFITSP